VFRTVSLAGRLESWSECNRYCGVVCLLEKYMKGCDLEHCYVCNE
jgi:hypothetical protein